jgi:hypothetical protein
MDDLLGTSIDVFVGVTVVIFGGAALLMGRAIGDTWRPAWQCVLYGAMLALADRFVIYALFGGDPLRVSGLLVDGLVIVGVALLAQRVTRARKMVSQYPWLYERAGPIGWRERA